MSSCKLSLLLPLLLLGCGRTEPADTSLHQENRAAPSPSREEKSVERFAVRRDVRFCPGASDFNETIDKLLAGNPLHPLPAGCGTLRSGSTLLLESGPDAQLVNYKGIDIRQAFLPSGDEIWSDELGKDSVRAARREAE